MRLELPCKVGYKVKLSGESVKNFNENNDDEYRVNMYVSFLNTSSLFLLIKFLLLKNGGRITICRMENICNCKYLEMAKLKQFISCNRAKSKMIAYVFAMESIMGIECRQLESKVQRAQEKEVVAIKARILGSISQDLYLGQCFSISPKDVWEELKETYDKLNGIKTFNLHHQINSLKQSETRASDYYHTLNGLWRQFDSISKLPACSSDAQKDFITHSDLIKLMQFLMGLDDVYQPIRSSLLSRDPIPDLKTAFSIISREESHRGSSSSSSGNKP
ncbi:ribonuclease H-like domain-containing protein [Tanacetum coccineum]